ncbi:MAG: hypothetical protein O9346_00905 [Leptospiraceae bacterium]|jgi:hypothetical protein|nr:hypothetical protein [Leptospiraceae bacterium]MCZ8344951.1 hypothetical protein [Leptospiraceae bacterium]PJE04977.1 MAG: hypothetical protein CK427_01000 [Leptospira sp.]
MSSSSDLSFEKFEEFSFFDNLALYYLCNETPPQTLALAFLIAEKKVCGSMLGVLEPKRRKYVHELMSSQQDASMEKKKAAADGMLIIADGLLSRDLIQKKGNFYFGKPK